MAQTWNYQTFYTEKEVELDEKLRYFKTLTGDADQYEQPLIFRNLYKLAFDFIDLFEESSYNFAVYMSAPPPVAPAVLPAPVATMPRSIEALNLYCKNMGIVIAAKILQANNVNDVKDWILENDVFQETMFTAALTFTPTVGAPVPNLSGPGVIVNYATEVIDAEIAATPALDTPILQQNRAILTQISLSFFNAATPSRCLFFYNELARWNALGVVNYAGVVAAFQAVQGRADASQFNAVRFLKNILLSMNRSNIALHLTYELTQKLLDNTPISFSSVKTEIDSDILETLQASTLANAAPNVLPKDEELTSTIFTRGNTVQDQVNTAMPDRLTHTCYGIVNGKGCNDIYNSTPPMVKVMSYSGKTYVSPIQTRGTSVAVIGTETTAWGLTISGYTAVVAANPIIPPPDIPRNPISHGTNIEVLDVVKAMPGPNPQPLAKNWLNKKSNDTPSRCTTNDYDTRNMRMLPPYYISTSRVDGHGDWQSMPNYATIKMILHSDKNFTLNDNGHFLGNEVATGVKVFKFKRTFPLPDTFTVPKNDSNCMLPWHWEMFAHYPTGKLLYYNKQNKTLTVNPPLGTYWKEWAGADYSMAYIAEIGYQEAKAKYEAGAGPRLSTDAQIALFQFGAHQKTIDYVATINKLRRGGGGIGGIGSIGGIGGIGKNKKKQHIKKTMSILKTAKRKYFTKRNNKKRNLY